MKTAILALAVACGAPGMAFAQANNDDSGNTAGAPARGGGMMRAAGREAQAWEPRKELTAVDVYLHGAINGTRALYESAQMPSTRSDASLEREQLGNIERALGMAQTHLARVRSMANAAGPSATLDPRTLTQLQADVGEGRAQLGELRRALSSGDRTQLAMATSRVYGALRAADDQFGQIADEQNLARVDRVEVPERSPVGGAGTASPSENLPPDDQAGEMRVQPYQAPAQRSYQQPNAPRGWNNQQAPAGGNY